MKTNGFTLIEILIVIGMIAILSGVVLVAVNPVRQFAQARNTQRTANVSAILNAIGERIVDNKGVFQGDDGSCSAALPQSATVMKSGGGYDIRSCLVPTYISELPFDPLTGSNACDGGASCKSYDTGYTVRQDSETLRISVCAPEGAEPAIEGSSEMCLTR
ncbi:MAG: type II secretion system protein [bacterium]